MNNQFSPANKLLNRLADQTYVDEWTSLIQMEKAKNEQQTEISVVIFRLNSEWFALNTTVFAEIAPPRKCHSIPHRSNAFLLGFVNLRGQFVLCVSLHHLLGIHEEKDQRDVSRLVALKKENMKFAFYVDEVFGVYHCQKSCIQSPPVTLIKSKENLLQGIFSWEMRSIGLLDEVLIFRSFQGRVSERK